MKEVKVKKHYSIYVVILALIIGFAGGFILQGYRLTGNLTQQQLSSINNVVGIIEKNAIKEFTIDEIIDNMLRGAAAGLEDNYAYYFDKEELKAHNDSKQGIIHGGIGVTVAKEQNNKGFVITRVYEDAPAFKEGIKAGDIITKVNGEDVTALDTTGLSQKVSGEVGTVVRITVDRAGQELAFDVKRAEVRTPMVEHRLLDNNIMYIQYYSFNGNAVEKFKQALEDTKKNNCTGVIIDLRDNLGGDLGILTETADLILPEGDIIYAQDRFGNRRNECKSDANHLGLPIVILVNGNSASASEAFTGAARDHNVAKIVGTKTYGKGIMQTTYNLENGGAFKLTIAKYYLPKGECIDGIGITPDYVVELPNQLTSRPYYMTDEEDTQLQKAIELLTKNN